MAPGVIPPNLMIIDQNTNVVCSSEEDDMIKKFGIKCNGTDSAYANKYNGLMEPSILLHRSVRNDVDATETVISETNGSVHNVNKQQTDSIGNEVTDGVEFKAKIRWPDLIVQTFLHTGAVYGLFLLLQIRFFTFFWSKYIYLIIYLCSYR